MTKARLLQSICIAMTWATTAVAEIGDCNDDGTVAVHELVLAVNISLGRAALNDCSSVDRNADGSVTIDELVAAVGNALGGQPRASRAFVVTSNFQAGSFATVDLDPPRAIDPSSAQRRIHSDAVVRTHGGIVYVINRLFADNIQALDPNDGFRTLYQCSTGNGSNPRDIAFAASDKAYVTLHEEAELLVVNPSPSPDCSDFELGRIDFTELADDDGIPDMDQMVVVDGLLYVSLQRLDINTVLRDPAGPAAIAIVDTSSDRLIDSIELDWENPFAATKGITVHNGALVLSYAGQFEEFDGGIERIDLATRSPEGLLISEQDLGGDVTDFVLVNDELGYAIVSRPGFRNALVQFFPNSDRPATTIHEVDGFDLFDIELNDRGEIYVADRSQGSDGILIFRAGDGAPLVSDPIDVGLSPFEIVFVP